jgi:hypothetical protein
VDLFTGLWAAHRAALMDYAQAVPANDAGRRLHVVQRLDGFPDEPRCALRSDARGDPISSALCSREPDDRSRARAADPRRRKDDRP